MCVIIIKIIYLDMFPQLPSVVQSTILGLTVGHEPGHLLGLVDSVVDGLGSGDHSWLIVFPSLIRSHDGGV